MTPLLMRRSPFLKHSQLIPGLCRLYRKRDPTGQHETDAAHTDEKFAGVVRAGVNDPRQRNQACRDETGPERPLTGAVGEQNRHEIGRQGRDHK